MAGVSGVGDSVGGGDCARGGAGPSGRGSRFAGRRRAGRGARTPRASPGSRARRASATSGSPSAGEPAKRLTAFAEDDGQQLYDLALSRDGTGLAFVRGGDPDSRDDAVPNATAEAAPTRQQVFVAATGGGEPAAVGEGHSPVFSPDGSRLAFTRRGEIWLWQRGGEARRLASAGGEIRRLQWSPDGRLLLFVSHRGDYSFVALLDPAESRVRFLDPGFGFSVEPVFSPDGRQVAYIRHFDAPAGAGPDSGPYWSIRVADVATGAARELWAAPPGLGGRYYESRGRDLFWSRDDQLVFPWERSGWLHPYALDAARGGAPRDLTPGAFEVEMFLLGADGRSLIWAGNEGDLNRRHIWRRPLAAGKAVRVTTGSGIETAPVLGGTALAVIASDVVRPAHVALVDGRLRPAKPAAAASGFVAPEPVRFRAADGVEVHGQLFRARGPGRHPAIVYVHGGPRRQMLLGFHPSHYYSNAYVMNQHLAARGYHVLAVNYRSGTGYGTAFRDAPGLGRAGASEYRDVLAAGRWLAARAGRRSEAHRHLGRKLGRLSRRSRPRPRQRPVRRRGRFPRRPFDASAGAEQPLPRRPDRRPPAAMGLARRSARSSAGARRCC